MAKCLPLQTFTGCAKQAYAHSLDPALFCQNWHYITPYKENLNDESLLQGGVNISIQLLHHSVLPTKYTLRHGYDKNSLFFMIKRRRKSIPLFSFFLPFFLLLVSTKSISIDFFTMLSFLLNILRHGYDENLFVFFFLFLFVFLSH